MSTKTASGASSTLSTSGTPRQRICPAWSLQPSTRQVDPSTSLAPPRIDLALLAQFTTAPAEQHTDVIHITPLGSLKAIPAGPAPTSLHLQSASLPGMFRPYSSTLSIESPVPGYSWTSRVAVYSQQQLAEGHGVP